MCWTKSSIQTSLIDIFLKNRFLFPCVLVLFCSLVQRHAHDLCPMTLMLIERCTVFINAQMFMTLPKAALSCLKASLPRRTSNYLLFQTVFQQKAQNPMGPRTGFPSSFLSLLQSKHVFFMQKCLKPWLVLLFKESPGCQPLSKHSVQDHSGAPTASQWYASHMNLILFCYNKSWSSTSSHEVSTDQASLLLCLLWAAEIKGIMQASPETCLTFWKSWMYCQI